MTTIHEAIAMNTPVFFIKQDSWERFEFHTKEEILVEEAEFETDHFALELSIEDGQTVPRVFVASSEDYSIHEDVTYHFEERMDSLISLLRSSPCENHTTFYQQWLQNEDEE